MKTDRKIYYPRSDRFAIDVIKTVEYKRVYAEDPEFDDLRGAIHEELEGTCSDGVEYAVCSLKKPFDGSICGYMIYRIKHSCRMYFKRGTQYERYRG